MRRTAALLALLLATGCSPHFTALAQGPTDVAAVRSLSPVYLSPLQIAFQPPPDWESAEKWANHTQAWSDAFHAQFLGAGDGVGRRPHLLPPGASVTSGLVVVVTVREIRRAEGFSGEHVIADVTMLDAASGRKPLTATLDVSARRAAVGFEGYTFGGRVKFAFLNLADAIRDALEQGSFPD